MFSGKLEYAIPIRKEWRDHLLSLEQTSVE